MQPNPATGGDHLKCRWVERRNAQTYSVQDTLWQYWLRLYDATGSVPYRAAFDPAEVADVLTHMAISERVDNNTQRVRLVGSAHDRMWGRNIVGDNLFDHMSPKMEKQRKQIYATLFSQGCACITNETAETFSGCLVPYQGLLLPLRNAKGVATMIIGAYTFQSAPQLIEELNVLGVLNRHLKDATFIRL